MKKIIPFHVSDYNTFILKQEIKVSIEMLGTVEWIEGQCAGYLAELKKHFSQKPRDLALLKGLDTNEKLGKFLEVSSEMARVYLSGEHKPQMKTLQRVSKKFKVSVEELIGTI